MFVRKVVWFFCKLVFARTVRVIWLDNADKYRLLKLRTATVVKAYGPRCPNGKQTETVVNLPDIYCHRIRDARVSITSSSFVVDNAIAIIERAHGLNQHDYNYTAGHILKHDQNEAVAYLGRYCRIDKGIFFGGNGSSNYYHWLIEVLVKAEFLQDLPDKFKDYPLLVNDEVLSVQPLIEALNIYNRRHKVLYLNKSRSYLVHELIVFQSPNTLPFNLLGSAKSKCSDVTIDHRSIRYLREAALGITHAKSARCAYAKKIFFGRKNNRRSFNQQDVLDRLSQLGFVNVFMEDLSFLEQVSIVQEADFIVGPTGAAWTNLVFCRPGTKALCWMAEEAGEFSAYATIARAVDVQMTYLTYKSPVASTDELWSKDYFIDPAAVYDAVVHLSEG